MIKMKFDLKTLQRFGVAFSWMMLTANCHIKKRPTVASKTSQLSCRIFVEIIDFQRGMYYFYCKFYL